MRHRPRVNTWAAVLVAGAVSAVAAAGGGIGSIKSQDLKDWLSYIASDELQGRAVYGTGFGLAAAYIENHLKAGASSRPAITVAISRRCAYSV